MKAFGDVSAALQVGVRRAPYNRSNYLAAWDGASVEKTALVDAGLLDLMRRAGATAGNSIQPLSTAPAEERRIAQSAAGPLMEAIDLGLREIVFKWALAAAEQNLVAPHEILVKLIGLMPKHNAELIPVLGERGMWLAELMDVEHGDSKTPRSSIELRKWLTAEWDQLDWKQRVGGVSDIELDLSPMDEELLNRGLADRRKEVRELAAKLLANLDGSAFSREIKGALRGRIRVEKKLFSKHLEVQPPDPEELPPSLPRSAGRTTFGTKAHAMFDLIRLVRPSFWEQETGLAPADLLSLANKTEYSEAIICGWLDAATETFSDQRWIDALFEHFEAKSNQPAFRMLAQRVSLPLFESYYQSRLKSEAYLPLRPSRFSPQFSKLVVEAAKNQTVHVEKDHERCLDPSVLPMLREPWDSGANTLREHWYRCIDLGIRLSQSLEAPEKT